MGMVRCEVELTKQNVGSLAGVVSLVCLVRPKC